MPQTRHRAEDGQQLRPQVGARKGRSVTSTLAPPARSSSPIAAGSSIGLMAKTMPGGLAAPDRQMGLGQVRQHEGDHIVLADAQAVEEVGGRRDAREEATRSPRSPAACGPARAGRTTAPAPGRAAAPPAPDHLVGAVGQVGSRVRWPGRRPCWQCRSSDSLHVRCVVSSGQQHGTARLACGNVGECGVRVLQGRGNPY